MASPQKTIQIEPGSEVSKLLEEAAESALILQANGTRYRVNRIAAPAPAPPDGAPRSRKRLEPERVLNIIGIGESAEESDIARFKDQYLAEAADHRGE